MAEYRIHGDNIVECERTLALIGRALNVPSDKALRPKGSPITPTFAFSRDNGTILDYVTLYPGYGRWDTDVLEEIRRRGGALREAADAVICRVRGGKEELLVALEYCGALPAGNQAWQRNGRAFSFAHSGVPYIYVAELSGFELDAERNRKAARLPNPAVPFSYLLLTEATGSPAIPVFVRSPGASEEAVETYSRFYGEDELVAFIRNAILDKSNDIVRQALEKKVLSLVQHLAGARRKRDSLTPAQWADAFSHSLAGGSLPAYLVDANPLPWSKTAYIEGLTASAKAMMEVTSSFARGLTSTSLPMCVVPATDRKDYANALTKLYPGISKAFLDWCSRGGHLAVCWVMGFKPRGDDARPDRGLPPLCRMLVGDKTDVLTVIYGPAPRTTWPTLHSTPNELMKQNGLWEAALICSDAILIDASTLPEKPPATYLKSHWTKPIAPSRDAGFAVTPSPVRVGENDVDTALHILFARLGSPRVFEGMCNPPGGDWSGVSLLTEDRSQEYRWLVLPRVTAEGAKRPDHIFQIFDECAPCVVLAIESKEKANSVEDDIGPRLVKYVAELVATAPSVERSQTTEWKHYAGTTHWRPPDIATGAAFVVNREEDVGTVIETANVDVVFGFQFPPTNDRCTILVHALTPKGAVIGRFLSSLNLDAVHMTLDVQ